MAILKDELGQPKPQYETSVLNAFEAQKGQGGASNMNIYRALPLVGTLQDGAVAIGAGSPVVVDGYGTLILTVTGTFVATIVPKTRVISGEGWTAIPAYNIATRQLVAQITSPGIYKIDDCGGLYDVIAEITGYTSGSVTVKGRALPLPGGAARSIELTGSIVVVDSVTYAVSGGDTLRNAAANKPSAAAAHAAIPFCYYFSIDTGVVEVTDSANWVVI